MTLPLTHEEFAPRVHSTFSVHAENGQLIPIELHEVSEFKQSEFQERFSLIFRGASETPLGQGTYLLEHSEMGSFDLFITPIRRDPQFFYYEAVFNRLRLPKSES